MQRDSPTTLEYASPDESQHESVMPAWQGHLQLNSHGIMNKIKVLVKSIQFHSSCEHT
jgi:GTP cyclohydrolase I